MTIILLDVVIMPHDGWWSIIPTSNSFFSTDGCFNSSDTLLARLDLFPTNNGRMFVHQPPLIRLLVIFASINMDTDTIVITI